MARPNHTRRDREQAKRPTHGRSPATNSASPSSLQQPTALLALQRTMGNQAVQRLLAPRRGAASAALQRHEVEDFDSYAEAKAATMYSADHLDSQKDDLISDHQQRLFTAQQTQNIYQTNVAIHGDGEIHADDDGRVLVRQDTDVTPHIDHRFPKARGGTNSFANARVTSAFSNISKGNRGDVDEEPDAALEPYEDLDDANYTISVGREFSVGQKADIYNANRAYYADKVDDADSGEIISDEDEETVLTGMDSSSVPHIDHRVAKSEGGTNFYFNAQVLAADTNIKKSGKRGQTVDEDWGTAQLTLEEYYEHKEAGTLDNPDVDDYGSDEEEKRSKKRPKVTPRRKLKGRRKNK